MAQDPSFLLAANARAGFHPAGTLLGRDFQAEARERDAMRPKPDPAPEPGVSMTWSNTRVGLSSPDSDYLDRRMASLLVHLWTAAKDAKQPAMVAVIETAAGYQYENARFIDGRKVKP